MSAMVNRQQNALVALTVVVTILFLALIRDYLIALFLAIIFTAMIQPLQRAMLRLARNRPTVASLMTLCIVIVVVVVPVLILFGVVAGQAVALSEKAVPWIEHQLASAQAHSGAPGTSPDPTEQEAWNLGTRLPSWFPFREHIDVSSAQVLARVGKFVQRIGTWLVGGLTGVAQGTAAFFLELFVMLYAMFFFLRNGLTVTRGFVANLPLTGDVKKRLLDRCMSISRATIKGTFIIGIIQGAMGGAAFAVAGIEGAAFWGTVMAVCSVIPSVGTAIVWVPAVIYMAVTGEIPTAIGLTVWCVGAVGSVDNVLRPWLVGNDTQMPDLLILVSTLGGLSLFGLVGIVLGPMLAGLFLSSWELFGASGASPQNGGAGTAAPA